LSLFKVDHYFALFRGQPPLLTIEELYFSLPSTFTLWNAAGYPTLKNRFTQEPIKRSQTFISTMISDPPPDPSEEVSLELLLPEDIQLYICATYSEVWKYAELLFNSKGSNTLPKKQENIRNRLALWKRRLDAARPSQSSSGAAGLEGCTNNVPLRFYYGVEDFTTPNRRDIAANRPKTIHIEATMLYHLLNIHLHSPIRTLQIFLSSTSIGQALVPATPKDKKQESHARQWAGTSNARRAVWHSVRLLDVHTSAPTPSLAYPLYLFDPTLSSAARAVSSIATPPFAVSAATCVLRTYCMLNAAGCALCAPLSVTSPTTDLSKIDSGDGDGDEGENECESHGGGGNAKGQVLQAWIRDGGVAAVTGLVLCKCNEEQVAKKLGAAGDRGSADLE
jgi:hypothetical protein